VTEPADGLYDAIADLSRILLAEESVETTLQRVADLATRTVPNCAGVGITVLERGRTETRAATSGIVFEVDSYQYEIDEGPCLTAVRDGQPHAVPDMTGPEAWPRWAKYTAARKFLSSLSLPMTVRDETLGALNLYANTPHAFGSAEHETASMFAAQAAVALANVRTYVASVELGRQLQEALVSRAVIEQAKGILMVRHQCDDDTAFETLRERSQRANRKLREIAREIVEGAKTGILPPAEED